MNFSFTTKNGGGFSFSGGFITLILSVLKITGVINWAWWIVFLPLIAMGGLSLLLFLFALISHLYFKKGTKEGKNEELKEIKNEK